MQIKSSLIVSGAALCALLALPAPLMAQAPPAATMPPARAAPSNARTADNCTPMRAVPKDGSIAPRDSKAGENPEPLGNKLAKSDGVLCPPAGVDPQMHAPAPENGTMPVIPPPGSPGGDPAVRPK